MEKTTLGLIAALGAASMAPGAAGASTSAADKILNPTSVAELLDPVAEPVATLDDLLAQRQLEPVEVADAEVSVGVGGVSVYHHHHHHHHRRRVIIYHHHHHHHHHHVYYHHHHHHHSNY